MRPHRLRAVLLATAIISIIIAAPAQSANAPAPQQSPVVNTRPAGCSKTYTIKHFRRAARSVYRSPSKVTRADKKKIKKKIHCARKAASKKIMRAKVARWKRWRISRERYWQLTPYLGPHGSRWAIPWGIVRCESGGSWSAYNPSGASGPYQLLGHGAPFPADTRAERMANHRIAARLWNGGRGRSAWVCKG